MSQSGNPAKFYSTGEEIFNAVSHGVGSLLSVVGTSVLATMAALFCSGRTVAVCLVYGASLILLYTMSTLYHAFPWERAKRFFRILDHSSIYLLIAGSYTPMTLLLMPGSRKAAVVCAVVWAAACAGIALNAVGVDRFPRLSMLLYVMMGWAAVVILPDVLATLAPEGFWLLLLGGICYTGGLVFYAWRRAYMHSVWHLFVLAGSVLHYFCILLYVVLPLS